MNQLVEIRTWPQCTDIHVIDVAEAREIAHYPINDQLTGPAFDPTCPFVERAQQVVNLLEADQEFLQQTFQVSDSVTLDIDPRPREFITEVLDLYGLTFSDLEISNTEALLKKIDQLSDAELFALLIDWFDVVESHKHLGYSARKSSPWIDRSAPEGCFLFHYLSSGENGSDEADHKAAYALFSQLVDADLDDYDFGRLLRWVYYHRVEFPMFKRPAMKAWPGNKAQV